ncbi:uncharacterized protein H6S33_005993, partial [Morchella sextelata]|uniref:uncharacterized protein n=1 Tax=Morchella sextelata TaxID=1174677 RepID=UPI001D04DAA7
LQATHLKSIPEWWKLGRVKGCGFMGLNSGGSVLVCGCFGPVAVCTKSVDASRDVKDRALS